MYYNIEVINNINIDFIVIVVNRTHYMTHKNEGMLVLNSDPASCFVLAVLSKGKTDFEICSKSNVLSKQTQENYRVTQ